MMYKIWMKEVARVIGLRFTDYLHLMKVDGSWLIVNKMFHHEPRPETG